MIVSVVAGVGRDGMGVVCGRGGVGWGVTRVGPGGGESGMGVGRWVGRMGRCFAMLARKGLDGFFIYSNFQL